jgi:hypothetical protein
LFDLHAESVGEAEYALRYIEKNLDAVAVAEG